MNDAPVTVTKHWRVVFVPPLSTPNQQMQQRRMMTTTNNDNDEQRH
jgi:hypothetical protein